MDSVSHTTDHNVSHMPSRNAGVDPDTFQRIEIITGVGRRRRWSAEEKARMVAESFEAGLSVLSVARRHGINPNQLYAWRRELRGDKERTLETSETNFAPVVVMAPSSASAVSKAGTIEVVIGGTVVRVVGLVDAAALQQVLDAIRRLP